MMAWFRRPKAVRVEFIDADTGKSLFRTDSPPGQLPESFSKPTSVQIEGVEYDVIRAEPSDAASYLKSARLKLWVRKRVFVPLNRILFSLPTITDRLPSLVEASGKGDFFDLHEDDWRQVELVSSEVVDLVDAEIAEISRVHQEARVEWGWSRMHVRREPARPLGKTRIALDRLHARFRTDVRRFDGLRMKGEEGLVQGGFAFETGSLLVVYGQAEHGILTCCGIVPRSAPADAAPLAEFCDEFSLWLVDWCRAERLPSNPDTFGRYFGE
jgi:hypothetical protein